MSHLLHFFSDEKLCEFKDIQERLQEKPYCLTVKEKGNLYILTYNMIASELTHPLVQEARGIILEKETNKIICHALNKFFNANELGRAAKLEEKTVRYLEKLDGSFIKLYYYDGTWRWASNGMIDIFDAPFGKFGFTTFGELLNDILADKMFDYSILDKDVCYFFELIHPANRIVVEYDVKRLVFLGARRIARNLGDGNAKTQEEMDERECKNLNLPNWLETPQEFHFKSIQECLDNAKELPIQQEGYVLVDAQFNRVKVKGESYVRAHHFGAKMITEKEILMTILKGETHEILAYQPGLKPMFLAMEAKIHNIAKEVTGLYQNWSDVAQDKTRKSLALFIKQKQQVHYLELYMALFQSQDVLKTDTFLLQNCNERQWSKALGMK